MNEPQTVDAADVSALSPATRHDGWSGEKIAIFCETLADTAVVAEACEVARMSVSGAYAARRRNPLFAAAWDAALTIARDRLADTLLARSIEGNVEQIFRDGVLVGERHLIDNGLGLAILRRLDRIAESGMAVSTRGRSRACFSRRARAPCPASTGPARSRRCAAATMTGLPMLWRCAEPAKLRKWRDPLFHSLTMARATRSTSPTAAGAMSSKMCG